MPLVDGKHYQIRVGLIGPGKEALIQASSGWNRVGSGSFPDAFLGDQIGVRPWFPDVPVEGMNPLKTVVSVAVAHGDGESSAQIVSKHDAVVILGDVQVPGPKPFVRLKAEASAADIVQAVRAAVDLVYDAEMLKLKP